MVFKIDNRDSTPLYRRIVPAISRVSPMWPGGLGWESDGVAGEGVRGSPAANPPCAEVPLMIGIMFLEDVRGVKVTRSAIC